MPLLHPDRLFPPDPTTRALARRLYDSVRDLPILSPHGHTQAAWFAHNQPFPDPATLFIQPDHYVHRMLYSQGIRLEDLEIGVTPIQNPRRVWRLFAEHYFLFRGTPTRLWLDFAFSELFGLTERLSAATADLYFDTISEKLQTPEFRPRALFDRFRIEVLATTDSALDSLDDHAAIRSSGWPGRILPTFRPDAVVDPDFEGFHANVVRLGQQTGEDTLTWPGYLKALRSTRDRFRALGCTATDHGHPDARTANLSKMECEILFSEVLRDSAPKSTDLGAPPASKVRAEAAKSALKATNNHLFRAQMLTEFARMSLDDGLVMQLHPGSVRNHNSHIFNKFGRDMGADIPAPIEYTQALRPLLDVAGNEPGFSFVLFTLDESTYSRELAPLAGHYPCLKLGPPWWFHDSPEGMLRFRSQVTETAGFYNTAGFNDDTRAFLSIPARHDVARRVDCAFLAHLAAEHRIDDDEAFEIAQDLTINLVRRAYKL